MFEIDMYGGWKVKYAPLFGLAKEMSRAAMTWQDGKEFVDGPNHTFSVISNDCAEGHNPETNHVYNLHELLMWGSFYSTNELKAAFDEAIEEYTNLHTQADHAARASS